MNLNGKMVKAMVHKYKCSAPHNGGWCDGVKVGSRMRCPQSFRVGDKSRACQLGIDQGFDDMDRLAALKSMEAS
jgi:hypothetical protein